MERIILHVDANNAFLSWTALYLLKKGYKYDIRNRYAIIGGDEEARRGIVLAKSNLCKKVGVKTADTIGSARRKCPYLDVFPPNFKVYKYFSNKMYEYLCSYADIIERYSVDECFIDYTSSRNLFGDPIRIAYKIKDDIYRKFGFTVNVGVGNNKLLAKMASDFEKPNKVHTLFINEIKDKMFPLPIEDLFMVGKSSSKAFREMGVNTIGDLAIYPEDKLIKRFKKMGKLMHEFANGIDNSEVHFEREVLKSISSSTVLPYNYRDEKKIHEVIRKEVMDIGRKLRDNKMYASTVGIWIKYNYFEKISKQEKIDNSISSDDEIYDKAVDVFNKLWNHDDGIRSICTFISGLSTSKIKQLSLNDLNNSKDDNKEKLQEIVDDINSKYGNKAIGFANDKKKM